MEQRWLREVQLQVMAQHLFAQLYVARVGVAQGVVDEPSELLEKRRGELSITEKAFHTLVIAQGVDACLGFLYGAVNFLVMRVSCALESTCHVCVAGAVILIEPLHTLHDGLHILLRFLVQHVQTPEQCTCGIVVGILSKFRFRGLQSLVQASCLAKSRNFLYSRHSNQW